LEPAKFWVLSFDQGFKKKAMMILPKIMNFFDFDVAKVAR
jgi:hypothetical protein